MDKSLEQLPEPKLKKVKISIVKKTSKQDHVHVNNLDNLLDNKFINSYFKKK